MEVTFDARCIICYKIECLFYPYSTVINLKCAFVFVTGSAVCCLRYLLEIANRIVALNSVYQPFNNDESFFTFFRFPFIRPHSYKTFASFNLKTSLSRSFIARHNRKFFFVLAISFPKNRRLFLPSRNTRKT